MQYTLNVSFTAQQLELIFKAGQRVMICQSDDGKTASKVTWQSFRPFQSNVMTWINQYGIYASTSTDSGGVVIEQKFTVPVGASMNQVYTLDQNGNFNAGPGGSHDWFTANNQYKSVSYMTFGLFQDAMVNGSTIAGNAISAEMVLLASKFK